jgi:hypothetical protein
VRNLNNLTLLRIIFSYIVQSDVLLHLTIFRISDFLVRKFDRQSARDNNYFQVTSYDTRHGKTGERLCCERGEPCGCPPERKGIRFPRLSRGITMMLTDACASLPPSVARRQRVPLRVSSNFSPPY